MSMIGHLRAVTLTQLNALRENPNSTREFLHGKLYSNSADLKTSLQHIEQMAMQHLLKVAKQTTGVGNSKENEELREQIIAQFESAGVTPDSNIDEGLSLEKSWQSLHYLLTGTAWDTNTVLGKTILGGAEIGPDLGYGPVRYLEPGVVQEVAKSLKEISQKDLASRFDLEAMKQAKVYACRNEGELKLAKDYFTQVCSYYEEAAERGNAMLLYID